MNYSQQLVSHLEDDLGRKVEGTYKDHLTCTDLSHRGQMNLLISTCLVINKENGGIKVFKRIISKQATEQNTMFKSVMSAALKVDIAGKLPEDIIKCFASQDERNL